MRFSASLNLSPMLSGKSEHQRKSLCDWDARFSNAAVLAAAAFSTLHGVVFDILVEAGWLSPAFGRDQLHSESFRQVVSGTKLVR